jgi:hypothetical protein
MFVLQSLQEIIRRDKSVEIGWLMGSYLVVYPATILFLMCKVNQSWKVLAGPAEKLATKGASQNMVCFLIINV